MEFRGVIYGYRDPVTGKMRYIGQTENPIKRHKKHLKANLSVDKWLRSFTNPPQPEVLCEVTGTDRQVFLEDMANRETVAMFHHHTYLPSYPNEGGFNRSLPLSVDYKNLGRIGGIVAGRIATESGHLKRIAGMGGRISGRQNVESGHLARIQSSGGKAQGPIQGQKNIESGQIRSLGLIQGPKNTKNGHAQGLKNVANGWIQKLGRSQGNINGNYIHHNLHFS